ncbi:MAG: hypothetical protein ABMB14_25935 [Myxococcota bacterium]
MDAPVARPPIAVLLVAHGGLLIVFDAMVGFAAIRSTLAVAPAVHASHSAGAWVAAGGWLVVEALGVIGVLGTAAFELAIGYRSWTGEVGSTRVAALGGVVGSLLLLPASMSGCSLCGAVFWPLPLGFALATLLTAGAAPDPRALPPER